MSIFLQYLLRTITSNKVRTGLIVLSVSLSSALFFATSGLSTTIARTYTRILETEFGNADVIITADRQSPSRFLASRRTRFHSQDIDYVTEGIALGGTLLRSDRDIRVGIRGMTLSHLELMSPLDLEPELTDAEFGGRAIIVSRAFADEEGFAVGDILELDVGGSITRFTLAAVAEAGGYFQDTGGDDARVLISFRTAASLAGSRGLSTVLYVRSATGVDPVRLRESLETSYAGYRVRQTITEEERREFANTIVIPLRIMLFVVVAVSVYIIFSTFQLIAAERLPVVGTFRSVGASKRVVAIVLFAEAFVYGILGALFGVLLGQVALRLMASITAAGYGLDSVASGSSPTDVARAVGLALAMPLLSAAVPITRIHRIAIKDIILRSVTSRGAGRNRPILGLIFLAAGATLPRIVGEQQIVVWFFLSMLLVFAGSLLLIPPLTAGLARLLGGMYEPVFGHPGRLAARNISDNRTIINNVVLLCIGIAGLFLINTISSSVAESAANLYQRASFDMEIHGLRRTPTLERRLQAHPSVADAYGHHVASRVGLVGEDRSIRRLAGIRPERFPEFWSFEYSHNEADLLSRLREGRNIIPSFTVADRFGIELNDLLTIELDRRTAAYRVIGFAGSRWSNGDFALVHETFFQQDHGPEPYAHLYVQARQNPDETARALEADFRREGLWTRTVASIAERGRQSSAELFFLLRSFSVLAMALGSIGVFNNFLISFIDRRRSFALLRSIGMSRTQNTLMLVLESLSIGFIGTLSGLGVGGVLLTTIPILLEAFNVWVLLQFSSILALLMLAAGVAICLLGSVGPTIRTRKLNLIEALKYE